ncbi:MAG: RloB family protein [Peptococcia bacterium]|jgi:hypothetical protein
MVIRKTSKKYYFSVEGETEQWYLKWLQNVINCTEESARKVNFDCAVQKDPIKRGKSLVVTGKTEVYHFCDYESDEPIHMQQFQETMDNMKKAEKLGKQIKYHLGYSNLTFELWMLLHKADCNCSFPHRRNYLIPLNRAYGERFESIDEYKHENYFKRCLGKLELSDVIDAVNRAKNIMKNNHDIGYTLHQYKGFTYYRENPSLTIWEVIEKILRDCSLY